MPHKRKFKCRCSKCYEKHWQTGERGLWENIEIIEVSFPVPLRCKNCGHEYKSTSKAAQAKLSYLTKSKRPK